MSEDFVQPGQPSGWYKHPTSNTDFFWTGSSFATVNGLHLRRIHVAGAPTYDAATQEDAAAWVREHGVDDRLDRAIKPEFIVTLDHVPGYRIVHVVGVVFQLASASGWTAAVKGNQALDRALVGLASDAAEAGANALVGVQAATFGAQGGITSVVGGDAVGVLLTGTGVVVAKESEPP